MAEVKKVLSPDVEPIVMVRHSKSVGVINAGEIAGYRASRAAEIIAAGAGVEMVVGVDVDEDGNPLRDFADIALVEDADEESGNAANKPWVFDPHTDPFMTDGVSKQASQALHAIGLHTVEDVRRYIATAPEGVPTSEFINEIKGVTDAQAEKIALLYGLTTEHSDE